MNLTEGAVRISAMVFVSFCINKMFETYVELERMKQNKKGKS